MRGGALHLRDLVTAEVDQEARDATRRNHTATHLLHAALRLALGGHVKQAGSLVAPERLRFDFVHFAPLTREELIRIERMVNEQIRTNTAVVTEVKATSEAIAAGAMALFGEKYGDHVRVVSVPGFSLELCGGTHCARTGDIGFFAVAQEGGIAAGVRRIEAVTGAGAVALFQDRRRALDEIVGALNVPVEQAVETIERMQADVKRLARENRELTVRSAVREAINVEVRESASVTMSPNEVTVTSSTGRIGISGDPPKVIVQQTNGLERSALRDVADSLKEKYDAPVVLASELDGKVSLVVTVPKAMTDRVHAGHIVKQIAPIVGGGGGGRPDFAEAGGKYPQKIPELLREAERLIGQLIGE
jgi:alanyl-tRNA synthetase